MADFEYTTIILQIITLICTFLTPFILAISVFIKHIKKSKCGCCECLTDRPNTQSTPSIIE